MFGSVSPRKTVATTPRDLAFFSLFMATNMLAAVLPVMFLPFFLLMWVVLIPVCALFMTTGRTILLFCSMAALNLVASAMSGGVIWLVILALLLMFLVPGGAAGIVVFKRAQKRLYRALLFYCYIPCVSVIVIPCILSSWLLGIYYHQVMEYLFFHRPGFMGVAFINQVSHVLWVVSVGAWDLCAFGLLFCVPLSVAIYWPCSKMVKAVTSRIPPTFFNSVEEHSSPTNRRESWAKSEKLIRSSGPFTDNAPRRGMSSEFEFEAETAGSVRVP